MVTGGREGVAIGIMLGAEVMLDRCAWANGAIATSAGIVIIGKRILRLVAGRCWVSFLGVFLSFLKDATGA
jgi:hypothetical protein